MIQFAMKKFEFVVMRFARHDTHLLKKHKPINDHSDLIHDDKIKGSRMQRSRSQNVRVSIRYLHGL